MDQNTLRKRLRSLLRAAGPADLLVALNVELNEQLTDSAPDGEEPEAVPELRAWLKIVDGPLWDAASRAVKLEDEAGYPPADQKMKSEARGTGFDLGSLFPWMRK